MKIINKCKQEDHDKDQSIMLGSLRQLGFGGIELDLRSRQAAAWTSAMRVIASLIGRMNNAHISSEHDPFCLFRGP